MFKKVFITAVLAAATFNSIAQKDSTKTKRLNHYVGVQANQLLRQLINLNAGNTAISNPYLLIYSVNSAKYGWGLNGGFGYTYQRFNDKNSPANHETKTDDVFYRFGIGKKFVISKKFEGGCSFDFTGDYQLDKTFTASSTTFSTTTDSTASITINKIKSFGYGLQFNIGFHITERIMLATEATYYYVTSNEKFNVINSEVIINTANHANDSETLSADNTETEKTNFTITVPVALFLVVKF